MTLWQRVEVAGQSCRDRAQRHGDLPRFLTFCHEARGMDQRSSLNWTLLAVPEVKPTHLVEQFEQFWRLRLFACIYPHYL